MRLIGYSSKKLDGLAHVEVVSKIVFSKFGHEDFRLNLGSEDGLEVDVPFELGRAQEHFHASSWLGFYRKDVVGVWIDNQQHLDRFYVHPHSTVKIETVEGKCLTMQDWLSLAESLTESTQLNLAIVMGPKENVADYYRTPLGCGIGLIKVFWITCYGAGYSTLISEVGCSTAFHRRETFGSGSKAFVSAPSYEEYLSASKALLTAQKSEIGESLFNRLPVEKRSQGGSGWILNPKLILRFVSFVFKRYTTNWRRYQAEVVPEHYR